MNDEGTADRGITGTGSETGTARKASVTVFGSLNVDLVCRVAAIARPGETVLSPDYEQYFGGKGANQAVAAAQALGEAGRVAMVGAIGHDGLGEEVRGNLERRNVDAAGLRVVEGRTGCALISIDAEGENAITVASGANGAIDAGGLSAADFGPSGVLVLQMEVPLPANLTAARTARGGGAHVVLNLAPVPPALTASALAELLEAVDTLVVNESELASAAKLAGLDSGDDAGGAAKALAGRFALRVIATLGSKGVLLADEDGASSTVPALPIDPVDTTGAGDTFVGVHAAGLAEGLLPREAAARAAIAASLACLKLGAQSAMPSRAEIGAALAR